MLKYRHHDSVCTILPMKLRREVLDLAHSKWFSGHLGISKLTDASWNSFGGLACIRILLISFLIVKILQ